MKNYISSAVLSAAFIFGTQAFADEQALEARIAHLEQMMTEMGGSSSSPFYGSIRAGLYKTSYDRKVNVPDKPATATSNFVPGYAQNPDSFGVTSLVTRFGIRGQHNITDDVEAIYRFEYGLSGNEYKLNSSKARIGYVGLKGKFGDVRAGLDWSPEYNFVGGNTDIFTNTVQVYPGNFRVADSLHYRNSVGNVDYQALVGFGGTSNGGNGIDRYSIGAGGSFTERFNWGAYYSNKSNDTVSEYGLSLTYKLMDRLNLAASYFNADNKAADTEDQSAYEVAAILTITDGLTLRAQYGSADHDAVAAVGTTGTPGFRAADAQYDVDVYNIGVRRQFKDFSVFATYEDRSDKSDKSNATQNNSFNAILIGARYDF